MKHLPMWKGLVAMAPTLAYDSDVLGVCHSLPTASVKDISSLTLVMNGGNSPALCRLLRNH